VIAVGALLLGAAFFTLSLYLGAAVDPSKSHALRGTASRSVHRGLSSAWRKALSIVRPRCEPHVWEEIFYSLAFRVRAGETLPQALRSVAEEGRTEAHQFLRRIVRAYEAGAPLAEAFQSEARGGEMQRLATAVEMGLATGSDLPSLLCHSAEVLSKKRSLTREAQAKIAEARITAILLIALPWVIGAVTYVYEPTLIVQGLSSGRGKAIVLFSLGLWVLGVILIGSTLSSVARGRGD